MKKFNPWQQFHWKIFLLRILVHAIALSLMVVLIPNIYFINFSILSLLLITLILGVLNALVKPILQVLTIRLLFVSYGLIIVLVNAVILYLLALLLPNRFSVDGLLWALIGGLLVGLLGNFLENLFGVTPPILPDEAKELRKQIAEQDVSVLEAWIQERKTARKLSLASEQAELAPEQFPGPAETEALETPPKDSAQPTGGEA
jgi:putative membrane protein